MTAVVGTFHSQSATEKRCKTNLVRNPRRNSFLNCKATGFQGNRLSSSQKIHCLHCSSGSSPAPPHTQRLLCSYRKVHGTLALER
ncbi:hypothetical protein GN956_G25531 [Arapaima gigas]